MITDEQFEAQHKAWLDEFVPRRFLRNGHMMTLAGNFLPRRSALPLPDARLIEVEAATEQRAASHVLCHNHWQPAEVRSERLTVLLVHGLEGSSSSQYVIGNASKAWAAGCNVIRMNMRNCGGTDHLSPTLYHSALSNDVRVVMDTFMREHALKSVALVGYSMGGNLVLKLAGELGQHTPPELKAVVGVSPAMDLGPSADALHAPQNRVYEWKFLLGMIQRFRRKATLFPEIYSAEGVGSLRSLREFDDRITAFYSGFAGADDYYYRAASTRVADKIALPTLVLHALDDPFIRMMPETREMLLANRNVTLVETDYGGHCAYLADENGYDGRWAEKTLLAFLRQTVGF